mgnify:CR=1 FL=1
MTAASSSARAGRLFVVVAAIGIALRLPMQAVGTVREGMRATDNLAMAPASIEARIEGAMGIRPDETAILRRYFAHDGRIVVYCDVARLPEALRHEAEVRVHMIAIGTVNMLYPTPRDQAFCTEPEKLQRAIDPALAGRLLVVDFTPGDAPLPVRERFELLHVSERVGARVRFWSLLP